ncbi:coagulase [Staphylococcus coagulans]|uniref:coagulase domain-containing protein n=1 Tax=Staphylococcus coagulans TaxID=74706 RepID=UPI001BE8DB26|nr:coagulase domain-containing protein [Staphylococcus coagulans]MBT2814218.1 coagulase [Staphylococcus coagulans]MBT2816538.1 coagulase [Staphylococcus coagulans]MBT2836130.1 coagulase [Staphylococcus coagulans]MBT2840658.1 coagulase [Staphylococcus coagulans]MBT2848443.1 coagulase [Staphylococcus coagulans]
MKKKLVVLSASAVLASHFLVGGEAFAIVSGEENPYKSKALSIMERNYTPPAYVEMYKKSIEDLVHRLTIAGYEKYDEPEYEEAVKKYKQRFMAEMEAMNQFLKEEKNLNTVNNIGLTYNRYITVYNSLNDLNKKFNDEIEEISSRHSDLKSFDDDNQYKADLKLNNLENKILMLGQAFYDQKDVVANLYSKLDLTVGNKQKERDEKQAVNKRMLDRKVEDLETIIDEFFEEIDLARPQHIPALTTENEKNNEIKNKLREDARKAKDDESFRHPRALKQKHAEAKSQFSNTNVVKPSLNIMEIEAPQTENSQSQVYTEATTQTPMYAAPQMKHESTYEVIQGRNFKPLATVNGEQSTDTMGAPIDDSKVKTEKVAAPVSQQENSNARQSEEPKQATVETETVTESHVVDIDESTTFQKSGYLYGLSQSDTSGYTDREKRAIKRNHVREAEALVNQYVDTHRYQDRIAAQQKVNTLSEAHQNRFNKMINKAYNGQ